MDFQNTSVPPTSGAAATRVSDPEMLAELRVLAGRKSVLCAYLLWFFLGCLCAHCFYLELWKQGALRLALPLIGVVLTGIGSGLPGSGLGSLFILAGGLCVIWVGVWYVVDLFRMPALVREHEAKLRARVRAELGLP